jgi:hypothetical protein
LRKNILLLSLDPSGTMLRSWSIPEFMSVDIIRK